VKYGPAGAEFSLDPYFTHVFHVTFASFGNLRAVFYSKKAKNGVLRVNFGAVAAGTPLSEAVAKIFRLAHSYRQTVKPLSAFRDSSAVPRVADVAEAAGSGSCGGSRKLVAFRNPG
jgi:hypothetical protein